MLIRTAPASGELSRYVEPPLPHVSKGDLPQYLETSPSLFGVVMLAAGGDSAMGEVTAVVSGSWVLEEMKGRSGLGLGWRGGSQHGPPATSLIKDRQPRCPCCLGPQHGRNPEQGCVTAGVCRQLRGATRNLVTDPRSAAAAGLAGRVPKGRGQPT